MWMSLKNEICLIPPFRRVFSVEQGVNKMNVPFLPDFYLNLISPTLFIGVITLLFNFFSYIFEKRLNQRPTL